MLTTLDVAKGMQRKHSKLIRDIDRVRSILPPDFAATAFIPDAQTDAAGNRQRSSVLTRDILPFLFMGQATKHELHRMDETARAPHKRKAPAGFLLPGLLASCLNFEGFPLPLLWKPS